MNLMWFLMMEMISARLSLEKRRRRRTSSAMREPTISWLWNRMRSVTKKVSGLPMSWRRTENAKTSDGLFIMSSMILVCWKDVAFGMKLFWLFDADHCLDLGKDRTRGVRYREGAGGRCRGWLR